ncbi:hypothetical protein GCM10010252_37110 [Streptomyces aureoverticillatus]|nr:hypothetical protein GCM10010252_37110 [Streptomyces aureoverticillatus]
MLAPMTQPEHAMAAARPEGELPLLTTVETADGTRIPVRGLRAAAGVSCAAPSASHGATGEAAPPAESAQSVGSAATAATAELAAPAAGAAAPVVLVLPAMGTPVRVYRHFARELHAAGLGVVTADLRGQGESTPRVTDPAARDHGFRTLLEQDFVAVLQAVRAEFGSAPPLFLLGHSLGGQLALLYAAAEPGPAVDGVVLVAAGSVWYRAYGARCAPGLLAGTTLMAATATLLGRWPGTRLGFGGNQTKSVMRDWARQGRTGRYRPAGSTVDYESALRALAVPVLAVSVEQDTYAPASAVTHLLSKAPHAPVTRRHYTQQEAGARLDHFAWTRAGGPLARGVAEWAAALPGLGRDSA